MDFWDPWLVNNLAAKRPVIIFDQAGVGRSNGNVATNYQGWAGNVVALVHALGLTKIDLLGFSMGGCTVQMVALTEPQLIRKLIVAGSGPSQPAGPVPGIVWPRDQPPEKPIYKLATAKTKHEIEDAIALSFFPGTEAGRRDAQAYFSRIYQRSFHTTGGEPPIHSLLDIERTSEQRKAYVDWSTPNPNNSFDRLSELKMPVLLLNGDDDVLIPTSRSWEMLKCISNAQLIIYPRAGHGFLWQYAEKVANDINAFLDGTEFDAKL